MMKALEINEDMVAGKIGGWQLALVDETKLNTLFPAMVQEKTNRFAAAFAHEVRNPLTNIKLALGMLDSKVITAEQKLFIDIIMRASLRINNLVTELLTSCQPVSQQLEKHNIHELLDEVLEIARDRMLIRNIEVKKYYTNSDCVVLMNKQKLMIALTNIVINAIEAMKPGAGELKLITSLINQKCIVEIADNGIGISKENLHHIFEPYFTNKPGGLGLGLSTTLDILLLNKATLVVKSAEGEGTNFIITFGKAAEVIE